MIALAWVGLYLLAFGTYLFFSAAWGASWGPRLGEPDSRLLWTIWLPIYAPYRLYRYLRKN